MVAGASARDDEPAAPSDVGNIRASLGELIREARSDRFTIDELSRRAGVSSGRISEIERGLANPSFETLWKLATALETPVGSFFPRRPCRG